MLNFRKRTQSKQIFIFLSLALIMMTITLTVIQTKQTQDLQSSAASNLNNCTIASSKISNNADEKKLRNIINTYRKEKNLPALAFQEDLNRAAAWKSSDMIKTKDINHTDSARRNFPERIKDCGYHWSSAVENLASTDPQNPQGVFDAWKKSSIHNKNMLCKECTQIGLATEKAANGEFYWTMTAGSPKTQNDTEPPPPENPTNEDEDEEEEPVDDEEIDDSTEDEPDDEEEERQVATPIPEVTLPPAPQSLPDGTTGILLHVAITGIGEEGNTQPRTVTRPVTVTIGKSTTDEGVTVNGSVTYNSTTNHFTGAIELPSSIQTGAYIVKVKTEYSLIQTVSSGFVTLTEKQTTKLPQVILDPVDLNEDNVISFVDVLRFRTCLNGQTCNKRESDLNDDGKSDLMDFNVFGAVFGNTRGD